MHEYLGEVITIKHLLVMQVDTVQAVTTSMTNHYVTAIVALAATVSALGMFIAYLIREGIKANRKMAEGMIAKAEASMDIVNKLEMQEQSIKYLRDCCEAIRTKIS